MFSLPYPRKLLRNRTTSALSEARKVAKFDSDHGILPMSAQGATAAVTLTTAMAVRTSDARIMSFLMLSSAL